MSVCYIIVIMHYYQRKLAHGIVDLIPTQI